MTKLKVTFESKKAMAQFLINGGELALGGSTICFSSASGMVNPFRIDKVSLYGSWNDYEKTFEVSRLGSNPDPREAAPEVYTIKG